MEDVLARRTRSLFLDAQASLDCAVRVAQILAEELGHDEVWQQQQVEQYGAIARGYLLQDNPEAISSKPVMQPQSV